MKRFLLLALLALVAALGGATAAQADSLTITPNAIPAYTGGDGTGSWYASSFMSAAPGNSTFQYEVRQNLFIGDTGLSYRDTTAFDSYSDQTFSPNGIYGNGYPVMGIIMHNTPSSCPYHGFHWFGVQDVYRWRSKPAGHTTWNGWTAWITSAVGPGTYGQACL